MASCGCTTPAPATGREKYGSWPGNSRPTRRRCGPATRSWPAPPGSTSRPASDSASGCCRASLPPLPPNGLTGSCSPPAPPGLARYSLPLFRGNSAPLAQPRLHAGIEPHPSHPSLRLSNTGTLHARLNDLAYITSDGQRTLLLPGLAGYLLAGHERRWALPARADGYADGHFQARLQDGRVVDLTAPDPAIAASAPSGL